MYSNCYCNYISVCNCHAHCQSGQVSVVGGVSENMTPCSHITFTHSIFVEQCKQLYSRKTLHIMFGCSGFSL